MAQPARRPRTNPRCCSGGCLGCLPRHPPRTPLQTPRPCPWMCPRRRGPRRTPLACPAASSTSCPGAAQPLCACLLPPLFTLPLAHALGPLSCFTLPPPPPCPSLPLPAPPHNPCSSPPLPYLPHAPIPAGFFCRATRCRWRRRLSPPHLTCDCLTVVHPFTAAWTRHLSLTGMDPFPPAARIPGPHEVCPQPTVGDGERTVCQLALL